MQESGPMVFVFVTVFPITEIKDGICVSISSREPVSQRVDITPYSSLDYFFGRRAHSVITVSRSALPKSHVYIPEPARPKRSPSDRLSLR